ncbi:MAG: hypothetical protein AB2705_19075 [Candidatus Thiodiazotropha sp.]
MFLIAVDSLLEAFGCTEGVENLVAQPGIAAWNLLAPVTYISIWSRDL